ncbi:SKP1-like protein, partial [Drosera capensis]
TPYIFTNDNVTLDEFSPLLLTSPLLSSPLSSPPFTFFPATATTFSGERRRRRISDAPPPPPPPLIRLEAPIHSQMMKSYIWLQTTDGSIQQVEQDVAMFCPFMYHEIHQGKGTSKNHAICLPQRVNPSLLSLILDYCHFHQVPGHSNKERKSFDEKFIRMDTKRLCELASAADSLQLKPLVELTSRALARMIEGKTPEEIREIFCLPDDLTEEEKLEPLRNINDDPRIRLLNRLYAKRRKELRERDKLKTTGVEGVHSDDRSVDDLLSFINGSEEDSKAGKSSKSKKKSKRRKEHPKNAALMSEAQNHEETKGGGYQIYGNICSDPSIETELDDPEDIFVASDDMDDEDGEIDPAIKEKIDREVADFRRRLNLKWPEQIQELLYGARMEKFYVQAPATFSKRTITGLPIMESLPRLSLLTIDQDWNQTASYGWNMAVFSNHTSLRKAPLQRFSIDGAAVGVGTLVTGLVLV